MEIKLKKIQLLELQDAVAGIIIKLTYNKFKTKKKHRLNLINEISCIYHTISELTGVGKIELKEGK